MAGSGLAVAAATAASPSGIPGAEEILAKAARENFPVALRVLPREGAPAARGDLRLRAARRRAGDLDRATACAARLARGRPRPRLRRSSRASAAARVSAVAAELALPREPFLRLIEANRQRPGGRRAYATFDELVDYCDALGEPGRRARAVRLRRGDARADRAVGRVCTALQLARALAGRGRGLRAPAASTCRPRTSSGSASTRPTSRRARRARAPRLLRLRGRAGARAARRGRAARRHAARPRAARGRRLRRRRARGARRDRAPRLRRARGHAEGGASRARARTTLVAGGTAGDGTAAPAYEHCRAASRASRGSSFYAGMRLLPPDKRDALFAVYALARRIDDIADGDAARRREARRARAAARRPRARSARQRRPGARRASPTPRAATRSRSSAFGELVDGAEMDVRGRRVRDVRRARALLPLRRGLDRPARRSASSTAPTESAGGAARRRPRRRAADRRTSCATSREDLADGRVYLPREDLERVRLPTRPTGRIATAPVELADRLRGRSAALELATTRGLALVPLLDRRSAACVLGDGRHLPAAAAPDRRRARRSCSTAGCRCRGWEKGLRSPRRSLVGGGRDEPRSVVVGGGLAGITAALELRRRRRGGDAARGAAAARRRDVLVRARRPLARQRPARRSCAAAPRTSGCSTASASTDRVALQPRLRRSRCCAPGGPAAWLRRERPAARRCTSAGRCCATRR